MTLEHGSRAIDGSLVSAADAARLAAEEAQYAADQRRAARVVAAASLDLPDCRLLLDVLGLDQAIVREARRRVA
jgi:hypothetical protein